MTVRLVFLLALLAAGGAAAAAGTAPAPPPRPAAAPGVAATPATAPGLLAAAAAPRARPVAPAGAPPGDPYAADESRAPAFPGAAVPPARPVAAASPASLAPGSAFASPATPARPAGTPAVAAAASLAAALAAAPASGASPPVRPATLTRPAAPPPAETRLAALAPDPEPGVGATGGLCGDRRLAGARIPAIDGEGACGVAQPVRLSAVAGVRLDPPVSVGCGVARALADWTEDVARPAAEAETGARLAVLKTAAGYVCRTRNHKPGARLSEHAKGNAIDIRAFRFADGREITVREGWRDGGRAFLRRVWKGACGPFGTVLGPDSDAYHRDHFHFDTANADRRYCR